MTTDLWNKMWGNTEFVPADKTQSPIGNYSSGKQNYSVPDQKIEDKVTELEKRVKTLEMRLSKLSSIWYNI